MIKLVATDMDGTFLDDDKDYDRVRFRKIYQKLREQAIRFVVISGNQFAQLRSFFPDIQEELIVVSENGAFIHEGNQLIHENHIERKSVQLIMNFLAAKGLLRETVLAGLKHAYIQKNRTEQFAEHIVKYYHDLVEVDDLEQLPEDSFAKFSVQIHRNDLNELMSEMNATLSEDIQAVTSGNGTIDIISSSKHKGYALKFLGERWGILPDEMMAFGDGDNDLEMLAYVGHSYAMENASTNCKQQAKNIAPSNQLSGVIEVLEALEF
ncbi:Cof-type HAD-IIB family hydrolase [Streptococcus suis]|nr:HAD family hydrolase [Streptococcus suis]